MASPSPDVPVNRIDCHGQAPLNSFPQPNTTGISRFGWGASEAKKIQFRCEMYNAFKYSQFTGIDTASRWDAQGRQVNQRFGEVIAAAGARRIQLGLKISF